ncbi:hypothetical protein I5K76_07615, partial [Pseudomonas aeruginosa]|nr:hypothetical protein [Pseudomonas aeruginosa]
RVEALGSPGGNALPGHLLDGLEQLLLARRHQRERLAAAAGAAASSAN